MSKTYLNNTIAEADAILEESSHVNVLQNEDYITVIKNMRDALNQVVNEDFELFEDDDDMSWFKPEDDAELLAELHEDNISEDDTTSDIVWDRYTYANVFGFTEAFNRGYF